MSTYFSLEINISGFGSRFGTSEAEAKQIIATHLRSIAQLIETYDELDHDGNCTALSESATHEVLGVMRFELSGAWAQQNRPVVEA